MPAFNTSPSREPSSRTAKVTRSLTWVSLATSQVLARTLWAGNFAASSVHVAARSFSLRAQRTTLAPSRRKCSAMTLPSPWLPPVMIALRFLSFIFALCPADRQVFHTGNRLQFPFQKPVCVHEDRPMHLRDELRPVGLA